MISYTTMNDLKKKLPGTLLATMFSFVLLAQGNYNSWEQISYSGPGLKQIGQLATKHSKEIKSSHWSVGCETLDRDYANFEIYKNYVGELGVKYGRLQSGWAKCEKQKGKYNFAWLDSCVYGLEEQSVEPWVTLCYGNPLYKSEMRLGAKVFTNKGTMDAWLKYVEATVNRYKGIVTKWEVWNEPNLRNGGYNEYGSLLSKTAEVIKRTQPDAEVIGFALAGMPLKFADEVFRILKADHNIGLIDYLSYHPYTNNPDDSYKDVEKLKALAQSYNPDIKLFQGENGCPSQLEFTHALKDYLWTEISQAKWRLRRMAGDAVRSIPSSIFTIIDLRYPNMLQSFGLIRSNLLHEIVYKRPSFYAVQHMTSFFDDAVESKGIMDIETDAYRNVTVAGFEKEERPVALVWYNDRIPDDELKWDLTQLKIKNTNFKNPVYVEMISGKVYEIKKEDWKNIGQDVLFNRLPVWDCVVMITEKSLVQIKGN